MTFHSGHLARGGAAVLGVGWTLLTRERKPGLPVLYAPPEGLGRYRPSSWRRDPGDHDIAATVFHLAQEGLLAIATKPRSWTATATQAMTPEAIAAADPASQALINASNWHPRSGVHHCSSRFPKAKS